MMEGVSNEAASIAGSSGLGKLIYCYDDNRITIDGTTSLSLRRRGHRQALRGAGLARAAGRATTPRTSARSASEAAEEEVERPSCSSSSARTSPTRRRTRSTPPSAHGAPLGEEEVRGDQGGARLGPGQGFLVRRRGLRAHEPDRARDQARRLGEPFEAWSEAFPAARAEWEQRTWSDAVGRVEALPECGGGGTSRPATPAKAACAASRPVPTMIGGAADLVESTKTEIEGGGVFSRDARRPQHRVRHPRARDGLDRQRPRRARRDVKPYGSTFLIFSDYMRPAVRLSALMGCPVVWVWTHDSVGARRGRADAPADRALRRAARDPQPLVHPPGRRERDGLGLEGGARADGRPGRPRPLAREGADARRRRARPGERPRARRLRALGLGRRRARPDPDRDRPQVSLVLEPAGPPRSRRPEPRCRRRLDALLGASSRSSRREGIATRCYRPEVAARLAVRARRAGTGWDRWVGGFRGGVVGMGALRRVGPRRRGVEPLRLQRRQRHGPGDRAARTGVRDTSVTVQDT